MIRVKNTALDRTKTHLHRVASKLHMEPIVHGQRLRLGDSTDLSEEVYQRNKGYYDKLIADGTIEFVSQEGEDTQGLKMDGPTLEEWVKAGYDAENYPPRGYAEKPSAGLTKLRKQQAADAEKSNKVTKDIPRPFVLTTEEKAMVAAGKLIEAVRSVRDRTDCSMSDAKDLVDSYQAALGTTTAVMPISQQAELVAATTESTSEPAGASTADSSSSPEDPDQKKGPGRPKKKLV